MSKNYRNGTTVKVDELSVAQEVEALMAQTTSKEEEEVKKEVYSLESSSEMLLKEINTLPVGEERTRAISDLKNLTEISQGNKKLENDKEFQEKQIKQNRRNTILGILGQVGTMMLGFAGYTFLSYSQTKWEMEGNTPATTPGKEIARGASRFLRFK